MISGLDLDSDIWFRPGRRTHLSVGVVDDGEVLHLTESGSEQHYSVEGAGV